jgi:hypothetical protein
LYREFGNMNSRIALWVLAGIIVACCWAVVAVVAGPGHNLSPSIFVEITAPASLVGQRMRLGVIWFILLNGAFYAVVGLAVELVRKGRISP